MSVYPPEPRLRRVPLEAPAVEERSTGELIGAITSDLSLLMRQELELAKVELKREAVKGGKAAGFLGGASFAGYMVAVLASFTALFAISIAIGLTLAGVVVTVMWGAAGAFLALRGRTELRRMDPKPERTIETLKEDAQWARHPTSSR